jgi:FAD:protein FMN transferase
VTLSTERMLHLDFRCMASPIHLELDGDQRVSGELFAEARAIFSQFDADCSRFIAQNPLSRLNASPNEWHEVPDSLFSCIRAAYDAYLETDGAFDPRVLADITRLGYVESVEKAHYRADGSVDRPDSFGALGAWEPEFANGHVRVNGWPVDLGGIAKGAAVARVADSWRGRVRTGLINAGGDLAAIGAGPEGAGWRIGIEDPHLRHGEPVAVIDVIDRAVATSSIAIHQWSASGVRVHHLIDPATGRPAAGGIAAVTVVADSAIDAEVWSKALFIAGAAGIDQLAQVKNLAALWVTESGEIAESSAAEGLTVWKADNDAQ